MIRWLDRVVPLPDESFPAPANKEAMQRVTRQAAFEPESWTPERAAKVTALFDELAPEWNQRYASISRYEPVDDALARGEVGGGVCLEVGSGTGLVTAGLAEQFGTVIGVDLSFEMLVQGSGPRVLADAHKLPLADASVDSAVLVNALLFPLELDRVLRPGGAIVWVNTRGDETPIHLPPEDVARAMPGDWTGIAAQAGAGLWAVVRKG